MGDVIDWFSFVVGFLAFIFSTLLFFKKSIPIYLKAFSPFSAIDTLVSILTTYLANKSIHTIPIENALTTFEFCFYIWVLGSVINNLLIKKLSLFILFGFPITVVLNVFLIQGYNSFHTLTYSIGSLIVISLSIYYFFELFQTQYAIRLAKEPGFWIASGLLFYYSVSFPLFVSLNLMRHFPLALGNEIGIICSIMNFILYSLFCISLICKIQIKKLFSS